MTASLRQRVRISKATPQYKASQNMGWVMADSNFEKINIRVFLVFVGSRR